MVTGQTGVFLIENIFFWVFFEEADLCFLDPQVHFSCMDGKTTVFLDPRIHFCLKGRTLAFLTQGYRLYFDLERLDDCALDPTIYLFCLRVRAIVFDPRIRAFSSPKGQFVHSY